MQKVNILVYGLNKLGMKIFVGFLKNEFAEDTFDLPIEQKREYMDIVSDVKYIHGRKYVYQKEKCIYGAPKWEATFRRKRKINIEYFI